MSAGGLSAGARRVLETARAEAHRLGHEAVGAEHLALGLLRENAAAREAIRRLGLDPTGVAGRLQSAGRRARSHGDRHQLAYTSQARRLIQDATREAGRTARPVSAEHLLLAALQEPRGMLARVLGDSGVEPADARLAAEEVIAELPPELQTGAPADPSTAAASPGSPPKAAEPPAPRWRYALLVAVPLSMVLAYLLDAPAVWVFVTACLGVLPLASYMGEATEHLAARTSPTIGGLLNATFGNAAELIIALVALQAGLVDLVKASITGSMLGNLLLIMGLAIVAGGLRRPRLRFNRTTAGMSAGMMALAVVAMVFPALYHATHPGPAQALAELRMSEGVSVVLLATYGLSLLFTLKTHRQLFGGEGHPVEGSTWSVGRGILVLAVVTVGVAIESELLVHAAEAATEALGLSTMFLGLIIIPIIGNAAEHAAAVALSRKGQIDVGLQIALGSSTQIALLVAPVLVFAGVLMGRDMDLVFAPFEVMALGLATVVTSIITLDGESHWFEGAQLLAVYAMVALGAFFLG